MSAKSCGNCARLDCYGCEKENKKRSYELTPAQKHAEELLKELKDHHRDRINWMEEQGLYADHSINWCKTCQLIAKAEGRE